MMMAASTETVCTWCDFAHLWRPIVGVDRCQCRATALQLTTVQECNIVHQVASYRMDWE